MATVIVDTDEGTLHVTQSGFDTNTSADGDEVAGMRVTVVYEGGLTEVLTWQATGGTSGGVTGSGMTLTMSTAATFTLTSSMRVVSLTLEGEYGNAVFDTLKGVNDGTRGDTLGSKIGFPYEEMGGDPVSGTVAVTYSDGVIRAGLERGSDIFTTMSIDYSGVAGGGILGTIQFRSDMDNIAVPGDLAPVTANTAPDAVDDAITTNEDTAVNIAVRGNDTDADGDALTVQSVAQGAHGAVTINPDGTVRYVPNANYNGADSFTYTLSDGNGGVDTATVSVTVTPVNDAPVAVNDAASTAQGVPVDIAVLANDTDVEGDPRTVTSVTQGANGSVAINPNGTVKYTPNAGFGGSDSFTYSISDGKGGTSSATVTVGVGSNAAPVAGDDAYSINEDAVLTVAAPGVQSNDTDANGDALTVSLVSGVSHGSLTLNANGSFTYTPSANYFGADSFSYAVSDGRGGTDTAVVALTVNPVNDAPVANDDSSFDHRWRAGADRRPHQRHRCRGPDPQRGFDWAGREWFGYDQRERNSHLQPECGLHRRRQLRLHRIRRQRWDGHGHRDGQCRLKRPSHLRNRGRRPPARHFGRRHHRPPRRPSRRDVGRGWRRLLRPGVFLHERDLGEEGHPRLRLRFRRPHRSWRGQRRELGGS